MIGRHAFGDQYKATDMLKYPGKGKLTIKFEVSKTARKRSRRKCSKRRRAGVAMAMYNLDDSYPRIRAGLRLTTASTAKYSVYLSTKNTILKAYDGRFKRPLPGGL